MRTPERILGTRCCIRYALSASNATSLDRFILKFERFTSLEGECWLDRRLALAWRSGKRSISEALVERVDRQVPGTKIVYAIATLLRQKSLSAPGARRVVTPIWAQTDGKRLWKLPCLDTFGAAGGVTSYEWADSASLVTRGDFHGFLAILALLRESVAIRDFGSSRSYALDLYAILPSICRIAWVHRDIDLLLQCVEEMMVGIPWIFARVTIDWDAFLEQVLNPKPWRDVPPWIVHGADDSAEASSNRRPLRPVPLLKDMEPLWRYVRPPRQREKQCSGPSRKFRLMLAGD